MRPIVVRIAARDFVHYNDNCRRCGRQWSVGKRELWDEQGEFTKVMRHGHGEAYPAAA
jgi:hypothetical protein